LKKKCIKIKISRTDKAIRYIVFDFSVNRTKSYLTGAGLIGSSVLLLIVLFHYPTISVSTTVLFVIVEGSITGTGGGGGGGFGVTITFSVMKSEY
jgi:hypothetical protein